MVPANRADLFFQAPTDILAPFSLSSFDGKTGLPAMDSAAVSADLVAAFAENGATLASAAKATVIAMSTDDESTAIQWRIDEPGDGGDATLNGRKTYLIIYGQLTPADTFVMNMQFIDNNPMRRQAYPGFQTTVPNLVERG